ncbi:unnamed protein product (macronuclear) [Paramecium tetraurelia]|uniref:Uncharacterized protein n=1 Tax=Paramecium tetraurelia TaxID=5888 RepID=A0DPH1_PARTE|nr:uncharacterized protein GSPATT00019120001 [Paramecium tetraurelia]CAK84938.1 unnamed protein product [Paramecium tetraurelia]|eukprot:XP_001452335.1 hypothetical protein (macronuclear) [Paramecium tetraurelia strain d4-2]
MLTYTDFCLKLAKIIKEEQIESLTLKTLVDETIDLLDRQQPPVDTYEEVIAKELLFYRTECQYLNKLRLSLQNQVKLLQRQLQEEKETNMELANFLKTQKQEQLLNKTKTEELNNIALKNESQNVSARQHKNCNQLLLIDFYLELNITQRQALQPQTTKQMQLAPHLTIEIKNIKTPLLEHQDPKNLKELFQQCVQQISRENQMRGNHIKKNKQMCSRDHSGQFNISEDQKDDIFSKLDIKTLTEKFFLNPQFFKMIEAQIFDVKCCNNKACLYNFKQSQLSSEPQQIQNESKIFQIPKKIPQFRSDHRSRSVGRQDDLKLQYQYLFADVLRLERELCATPKQNKNRQIELKSQLKDIREKLYQLQCRILN